MNASGIKQFVTLIAVGLLVGVNVRSSHATLLGHWDFNSNTSNSGSTGATNDATAVNGATYVAGPTGLGNALAINNGTAGTVHYASVNNSATGPLSLVGSSYTWSIWAKAPSGAKADALVVKDDGADTSGGFATSYPFSVYTHNGGGNYPFNTAVLPTDGAWHFYAGRYDIGAGSLDIFVDGTKVTLAASGQPALASDGDDPLRFGNAAYSDFPPNPAFGYRGISSGAIDDARIYDEALTDEQIFALGEVVPEPSSAVLTTFGLIGMLRLVRRKR
jgi:hypothetical protein